MKISKIVVAPIMALLLATGLATAGAGSAQARPTMPGHAPIACMLGGGSGISIEYGCGWGNVGGGGTAGNAWGYDRSAFTDTRDFSPWQVINDPRLFPGSDSGYTCIPANNGSALCTRFSEAAPKTGINNATVSQLANGTTSATGSVLGFEEKDNVVCASGTGCFLITVDYTKYRAEAMYGYDNPGGTPYIVSVGWYKKDGKGYGGKGSYIGQSSRFLTGSTGPSDLQNAAQTTTDSSLSDTTATTTGGDVTYQVHFTTQTAGSVMIRLKSFGFDATRNRSIPSGWIEEPSTDPSEVAYLVPNVGAGQSTTASLHYTVAEASSDSIAADVNGATTTATLSVRPAAPTCTAADSSYQGRAVVPVGGAVTTLNGVFCSFQSDSTLHVWTGNERGAGTLALIGSGNVRAVSYKAPTADYVGDDRIYVYAENSAGVASLPTPVDVTVSAPATAVADTYTVVTGTALTEDADHGVLGNDQFGTGRDGWTVQQGYAPTNGDLNMRPDGSFTYTPHAGFTGDDTFRYRLNGPHDMYGNVVTVTIHVTAG